MRHRWGVILSERTKVPSRGTNAIEKQPRVVERSEGERVADVGGLGEDWSDQSEMYEVRGSEEGVQEPMKRSRSSFSK